MARSNVTQRFELAVSAAAERYPQLASRSISPHTIRHTTAMHLLQSGFDISVIAMWLGHETEPEDVHRSRIGNWDVQDLVIPAVENRFGRINMLSDPIEWLTDNGSCFIARDTASLLREIGMEPCTTPVRIGMAEAFVKTFKRDYVAVNPTPDAETVMAQLPFWFEHYNNLHPHSALGYQSLREFINSQSQT